MQLRKYIYISVASLMFSLILLHNSTPHCHSEHQHDHQHSWLGLLLSHHSHSVEGDLQVKQFLLSSKNETADQQRSLKQAQFAIKFTILQERSFSWTQIQPTPSFEEPQFHKNLYLQQYIPLRGPPTFA